MRILLPLVNLWTIGRDLPFAPNDILISNTKLSV